jgi:hypothetical protein
MNDLIELLNHFQQRLMEKQKLFEIQKEDVHHSINRTFNKIFEQLIEIRRFCRNDIEQQTLNAQVCQFNHSEIYITAIDLNNIHFYLD